MDRILNDYQRQAKERRICTLMSACKLISNRADIMALWGVSCLNEMDDAQIVECGEFMEAAYVGKTTTPPEAVRRLRSGVLTQLGRLGKYATPSDWTGVNRFLLQKKISGRLLYMLGEQELRRLIRKLRAIADKQPTVGTGAQTPSFTRQPILITLPLVEDDRIN